MLGAKNTGRAPTSADRGRDGSTLFFYALFLPSTTVAVPLRLLGPILLSLLLFPLSLQAQHSASPEQPPRPDSTTSTDPSVRPPLARTTHRFSLIGGGSVATGGFIGNVRRSEYRLVGIRYHMRLYPRLGEDAAERGRTPTLTYTADVLPLVHVSVPEGVVPENVFSARAGYTSGVTTRGMGVSPVGLRINFRASAPVQPFIAGSAGILYFQDRVPDPRGQHTNFMVDFGGGVQCVLTPGFTLTLGYRYHHLSNGFRGEINPGIDAHLLYLGATVIP